MFIASRGVMVDSSRLSSSRMISSSFTVSKKDSCCMSTSSGFGTALCWVMLELISAISFALAVMSASLNSYAISFALAMTESGTPASFATWMP